MITKDKYFDLKARIVRFDAWVDSVRTPPNTGPASYKDEDIPQELPRVTNDERSQVEVYEFMHHPPDKCTVYVKRNLASVGVLSKDIEVTTWIGHILGKGKLGRMYHCGTARNRSLRYPIRFTGINGHVYKGTFYHSSGDYAQVKRIT